MIRPIAVITAYLFRRIPVVSGLRQSCLFLVSGGVASHGGAQTHNPITHLTM